MTGLTRITKTLRNFTITLLILENVLEIISNRHHHRHHRHHYRHHQRMVLVYLHDQDDD